MLFDLIVIGSGPAGHTAAIQGAKAGKKVAIIEDRAVGGGCVHSGTIPSKSFRESVYRWSLGSRGALGASGASVGLKSSGRGPGRRSGRRSDDARFTLWGEIETVLSRSKKDETPDMERLLRRRDRVVASVSDVFTDQLKRNEIKIYHGRGKILSPTEVEVRSKMGRQKLTASFIMIATGASAVAPSHLKVDHKRVRTSESILALKKVPRSLVVLGGGITGCEYASIFAMAGSKVHLVDRRHEILASVDREIVSALEDRFEQQGVEILLEAEAKKIDSSGLVTLSTGRKIKADVVLIALGNRGNTEELGLETVGIETDARGLIHVDKNFRTVVPSIYAVGDVVGQPALASASMVEGRIAARHAFGIDQTEMLPLFPYGIYTIPEISMMGATEEDLIARKVDYVAGKAHYRELPRGQITGDQWGLLKLLVDRKTQKILGVHIVGDNAADLIHMGQAVMQLGGDVNYFVQSVFNYPTLSEAYKTAAFHAVNQIGHPAN